LEALAGAENCVVNLAQLEALSAAEPGAAQADNIQTGDAIVPAGDAEWREILADAGAALHEGEAPDAAELMHNTITRQKDPIGDDNVACKEHSIGEDIVGADLAVVAYVTASHEKVFVANHGVFFELGGAMHGGVFTKDISGANLKSSRGSRVFEILWRIADHRAGMKSIIRADGGVSGEMYVRLYDTVGAQSNIGINHCKGTYQRAASDFCVGMHAGKRVDLRGNFGVHGWK